MSQNVTISQLLFGFFFNPLQSSVCFLYSLKRAKKLRSSGVFRGYKKGTPGSNGLNKQRNFLSHISSEFSGRAQELNSTHSLQLCR